MGLDAGFDADSVLAMVCSQDRVKGIKVKALVTGAATAHRSLSIAAEPPKQLLRLLTTQRPQVFCSVGSCAPRSTNASAIPIT